MGRSLLLGRLLLLGVVSETCTTTGSAIRSSQSSLPASHHEANDQEDCEGEVGVMEYVSCSTQVTADEAQIVRIQMRGTG